MRLRAIAATLRSASAASAAQEQKPPETSGVSGAEPTECVRGQRPGLRRSLAALRRKRRRVHRPRGQQHPGRRLVRGDGDQHPVQPRTGGTRAVPAAQPLHLEQPPCCLGATTRESKTYAGVLRRRDWDEPQDYTKFVRYIRYGNKREPLYVLAGQLGERPSATARWSTGIRIRSASTTRRPALRSTSTPTGRAWRRSRTGWGTRR